MKTSILCPVAVIIAATPLSLVAQSPTPAAAAGKVDPAAMQLIMQSAKSAEQLSTVYMEAASSSQMSMGGQNQDLSSTMRVWQKLPDKSYSISQTAGQQVVSICDGKQTMTYMPATKSYTLQPVTNTPGQTPGASAAGQGAGSAAGDMGMGMGGALSPKALESMQKMVQSANIAGSETVNGQPAKHLQITMSNMPMDIWLSDTTAPLPLRMKMDMNTNGVAMHQDTTFKWTINQPIPDDIFKINPPPDAKNVTGAASTAATPTAEQMKAMMGSMQPGAAPPAQRPK